MKSLIVLMFFMLCPVNSGPVKAQDNALQGLWRAVEINDDGQGVNPAVLQDVSLAIWQNRYLMSLFDGTVEMELKFGAPQTIELIPRSGRDRTASFRGRYELKDNELTIAYGGVGLPAPASANSTGEGIRRLRWARVPTARQGAGPVTLVNSLGMELRLILPGTFVMGSPEHEPRRLDEAQRRTTISKPFYMGVHEVTVGQFRQFAVERPEALEKGGVSVLPDGINRNNPTASWDNPGFPQTDRHPVVFVSWEEANQFCKWLSQKEGKTYRLPTEAEWEYAARGGTQTAFWWGDDPNGAATRANVGDRTFTQKFPARDYRTGFSDGHALPSAVGSYLPNQFGLFDVAGNALEWVQDWYGIRTVLPDRDPTGPNAGDFKVARGGGWANKPDEVRSAFRFREDPSVRFTGSGLRVLLQLD